jgi:uncharacterized DUF497 family protein
MINTFEWDENKNKINIQKHDISFEIAREAFDDPHKIILDDETHSEDEQRLFCIGKTSQGILTVRYVVREDKIRIIGAGRWRDGRKRYDNR